MRISLTGVFVVDDQKVLQLNLLMHYRCHCKTSWNPPEDGQAPTTAGKWKNKFGQSCEFRGCLWISSHISGVCLTGLYLINNWKQTITIYELISLRTNLTASSLLNFNTSFRYLSNIWLPINFLILSLCSSAIASFSAPIGSFWLSVMVFTIEKNLSAFS